MAWSIEDCSGGSFLSSPRAIPNNTIKKTRQQERLLNNPSQWSDHRNRKRDSKPPDFRNRITKESLWISDWYTPDWGEEELGRQRPQLADGLHGDLDVEEESMKRKVRRISRTRQEEKDVSIISKDNLQKSKENSVITLIASLQACAKAKNLQKGSKIHFDIIRNGSLENNIFVATTLINMYGKCGALKKAQEVFDKLATPNVVSWNALITGYAQHEHSNEALMCFEQMQLRGFPPDTITFACVLKACGSMGASKKGQEIHAQIMREHPQKDDIVIVSALVDMYAKCGELEKAQEVFNSSPIRSEVLWNALITGYAQLGHGEEALHCFKEMQLGGFSPDAITFACILKACGSIGDLNKGREVHAQIMRDRLLENDIVVGNALVDMYAKCGALIKAQEVFDELPVRDIISWTALLSGYGMHGHGEEALKCFGQMRREGFSPSAVTFACTLKACGSIGALDKGQEIHAQIVKECVHERHIKVGTSLLDMYANCGMLEEAQLLFDKLPIRDVVSWSALMVGYAQVGEDEIVLCIFDKMLAEGVEPNLIIFTVVLNTCNHGGLLEKGEKYFQMISRGYRMTPTLEHHTCMVDLFGRAGHLDKAVELINKMRLTPDLAIWLTLLNACQKWKNTEFGRWAFDHAILLDETDSAAYVCMSNLYGDAGRHDDARKIEAMRAKKKAWMMEEAGGIISPDRH